VTLVDRRNHHLFQPLLYQVATAALSPGDIASPIRWILRRQRNVTVLLAEARAVRTADAVLELDFGELQYDFLVLATGATHAYFGHDDWRADAPGLKTLDDALLIRRRVLLAFERAERETDPALRRRLLTFVIVGAGPTGVELAGSLAEIARHALARDFRRIDPAQSTILLIEGGPAVLSAFPPELGRAASRSLERLGVDVRVNTPVTDIGEGRVVVGDETIHAEVILWAAGVAASPIGRTLGVPLDRAGRVIVHPDLTVPGHSNVFAIGDLARFEQDGRLLPGVAQVAMQQGDHVGRTIDAAIAGRPAAPFRYRDYGNMATIGRGAAVADFGRVRISGFIAWLAWLFIHLVKLIGFRNRLAVMTQWAWSYVTYQRSVRLITAAGSGSEAPDSR
jgi:NADH dehydrogenase